MDQEKEQKEQVSKPTEAEIERMKEKFREDVCVIHARQMRWLREKHGIHIEIRWHRGLEKYYSDVYTKEHLLAPSSPLFIMYEDAAIYALEIARKYLENNKQPLNYGYGHF